MAQAMKRNLARWMFEMARTIMFQQGMVVRFFLAFPKLLPINSSYKNAENIRKSLKNMNGLSNDNSSILDQTKYVLSNFSSPVVNFKKNSISDLLEICISINKLYFDSYLYYFQLLVEDGNYDLAKRINLDALNLNPPRQWCSYFLSNIANISHRIGLLDDALLQYRNALNSYEFPGIHLNIGMILLANNQPNKSFEHFNRSFYLAKVFFHNRTQENRYRFCSSILDFIYKDYSKIINSNNRLFSLFNIHRGFRDET